MTSAFQPEIQANLERAEDSIQAANVLLENGYPDFAASRAYYAAFYTASALLIAEGFAAKTHNGVLRAINSQFVKTGRLDKQFGQELRWLAALRNLGDYGELRHVLLEEAERAISIATVFLRQIITMLERSD